MTPLAVFWFWPYSGIVDSKYAEVHERHLLIANNLGAALEAYHKDIVVAVDTFAPVIAAGEGDAARPIFMNLHFRHICVIDIATRRVEYGYLEDQAPCPDAVSPDMMKTLIALGHTSSVGISGVIVADGQRPRIVLVKKIGSSFVAAAIYTDFFQALQKRINFGRRGHAAIVDQNGHVLAHPSAQWQASAFDMSGLAPVRRLLNGESGVAQFYSPVMDAEMIAGFTAVPGIGWGVLVPQPISEFQDAASAFTRDVMVILSLGLVLSFLMAGIISYVFSQRLGTIKNYLQRVGEGDDQTLYDEPRRFVVIRELSSLKQGLSAMAQTITKARADTLVKNAELKRTNAQLLREVQEREIAEVQRDGSAARFNDLFENTPLAIREEDLSQVKTAVDALGIDRTADLARYLRENPDFVDRCGQLITVVNANKAAMKLHGFSVKKTMLNRVTRTLGPSSLEVVRRTILALHKGEKHLSYELSVVTKRGDTRHIAGSWLVISGHEKTYQRILLISVDLSDRIKSEERVRQAQKMEAVGQLTGGIAHDFNNLLTVIQGNVDLIDEDIEHARDYVPPVRHAVQRGSELTQRLLAFSRQQPLAPKTIDLIELIGGMTQLLRRSLGENISVDFEYQAELWPVLADPGQVENALLNLGLNARDAMTQGGALTIACSNRQIRDRQSDELDDGDYVMIKVSDTGTGMSADVISRAFEPFFTTKGVGKGSGLGLSMIYGFSKQSRGHAAITSTRGVGTTVCILLPRGTATAEPIHTPFETTEMHKGNGQTVLVLEDQKEVQDYLSKMLTLSGYVPLVATTASAACDILAAHKDLRVVLCDIMLPGGTSGTAFAARALKEYSDLKIIFISGNAPASELSEDEILRDCALLSKPFCATQLNGLLKDIFAS